MGNSVLEHLVEEVILNISITDVTDITDRVFLKIEHNQELIARYKNLCKDRSFDSVNREIGKYIRKYLSLTNIGRENSPKSTLIKSYEKHGRGHQS